MSGVNQAKDAGTNLQTPCRGHAWAQGAVQDSRLRTPVRMHACKVHAEWCSAQCQGCGGDHGVWQSIAAAGHELQRLLPPGPQPAHAGPPTPLSAMLLVSCNSEVSSVIAIMSAAG